VEINRRPKYGEIVTVSTWPRGGEKLFALRDFDIRDAADNQVVKARSCWVIIDLEKRRPLRPQAVMDTMPLNEGKDALLPDRTLALAIEQRPSLERIAERQALYTDVDFNGHVNNVTYIRWIEDTLDSSLLEKAVNIRLDINYLNEVLTDEITEIWSEQIVDESSPAPLVFAFEGRKAQDAQPSFRAELRLWK
jgi:acyl-ACP thioesterase